jgi:hypothetical protein
MPASLSLPKSVETLPQKAFTDPASIIGEFACRGVAVLSPESLALPLETHRRVYDQEIKARDDGRISTETVPAILDILRAPGLIASINQLVGENWAIVPFTHNAAFQSGSHDQMWHKDDNGPYNARKQRYHQSIQLEMLYYPQDVSPEMGPTAIMPYAHYWTFNHEENQDNFAGADHLDFDYMTCGMERKPVSGPRSEYGPEDILNATTAHDVRMRDAVKNTKWPLVSTMEAAPLKAGSVVLYSHNTFHRGNHRRDDHETWHDNPRFMWRFFIYRTTDSFPRDTLPWDNSGLDPLTGTDLSQAGKTVTECWRYNEHWMTHGTPPTLRSQVSSVSAEEEAEHLYQQMLEKDDPGEATRIGSAYLLASLSNRELALKTLEEALYLERENVRRAASYGLVALGEDATGVFLKACSSPFKWIRKAGAFGLGSVGKFEEKVVNGLCLLLHHDTSLYVRSVSADALGNLLRRACTQSPNPTLYSKAMRAMLECLNKEENRLSMDRDQNRSIKYVRPKDDQDVCEGGAMYLGVEPYEPVRSIVKENLLWSLVMLCSQGSQSFGKDLGFTLDTLLMIAKKDSNLIAVGFAMDALARLAYLRPSETESNRQLKGMKEDLVEIFRNAPALPVESLICAGVTPKDLEK